MSVSEDYMRSESTQRVWQNERKQVVHLVIAALQEQNQFPGLRFYNYSIALAEDAGLCGFEAGLCSVWVSCRTTL